MRLASPEQVAATVAAAMMAGTTIFDTARAYGPNEAWLADALRAVGSGGPVRIVTKGGMARPDGAWQPDGRARSIRADCETSLDALGGLPIDLYLLHAPDPRVPWRTSLRALARLAQEGLVARIGVCNVNTAQLETALQEVPLAAVQLGVSLLDAQVDRSGLLRRCDQAAITVMAHSPLGGPRRAARLCARPELAALGASQGHSGGEVALRWLLDLSPNMVVIPGCSRPHTIRSAMASTSVQLSAVEGDTLRVAFRWPRAPTDVASADVGTPRLVGEGVGGSEIGGVRVPEVVLIMGIPGAGKSRAAVPLTRDGYLRLNRDERGGSLRGVVDALDHALGAGTRRVVLDNTYLTRAARNEVIEVARRHGATTRCVWLDTPLPQAQINLTHRILEMPPHQPSLHDPSLHDPSLHDPSLHEPGDVLDGTDRLASMPVLPDAAALRAMAQRQPGLLSPASQMRAHRQLEPPGPDEGFDTVTRVPFERDLPDDAAGPGHRALLVAASVLDRPDGVEQTLALIGAGEGPVLLFDWDPDGDGGQVRAKIAQLVTPLGRSIVSAHCPHPGGPPTCWCRPPLPGLPLAFARTHAVNLAASTLVGTGPAHRSMARALGAGYVQV